MRPVSGRGRDQGKRGQETTILLLRYYCYVCNTKRCEIKPVAVRCDGQRVAIVVLVINAAREQAVPWLPLRCQGLLCYLRREQAQLSVKLEAG
jgi:hypothetical protein